MAQQIAKYSAVTNMRCYIYYTSDTYGGSVPYEKGTALLLPVDYENRKVGERVPVISPMSGYLNIGYIDNITPVYETVTDKCSAPTIVSISTASNTMQITGGGGGDLNTFTGFGISYRERDITGTTWGAWSADSVTTGRSVSVTASPGKVRQYRVRTRGSAGSAYYSDYVVCGTLVIGNTANNVPTIVLPANGAMSASKTPAVVINCSPDAEGDAMTLVRSVDGGAWTTAVSVPAAGGTAYDKLPALADGAHEIAYKVKDTNGGESGVVKVTITVQGAVWTRTIAAGDVISSKTISHQADIAELLEAINTQCAYYGLSRIALPGSVGKFSDWGKQMQALLDATNKCHAAAGQPVSDASVGNEWPTAAIINEIRRMAVGV